MRTAAQNSVNRAAKFHPETTDDERPAIEVAGVLVFTYVNEDGILCVSVDLDTPDRDVFPAECVPLRVTVQGNTVFAADQDGTTCS
jgi:hypothetical protein